MQKMESEQIFRSGFVSIIGNPNAGKSTLMNALVGEKLAIVTPKAQTTRHRIIGISTGENYQLVFSDTPGVMKPKYKLHDKMLKSVGVAIADADLILLLSDIQENFPEQALFTLFKTTKIPVFLVLNKADLSSKEQITLRREELEEEIKPEQTFIISALKKTGLTELLAAIINRMPEGPAYYDADQLTDKPERFFVSEIIREQIFLQFEEEIPYGTEVSILEYKDMGDRVHIEAEIHTERLQHKGMLIGKQGAAIRNLGTASRKNIEAWLDKPVFLQLYVRVAEKWKDNQRYLKGFGYDNI
jgi:GTP-binding protein Era